MSVAGMEWFAVGFFLVSLILFHQCEKPIKAESAEGYRRLAGGLALLSLTALVRLYQGIGMFQQVPFLSETVFFDLVYWVMVIAGGAMIVSGATYWLPLMRQNRKLSLNKIARLDLLKRIEQLIGVENRLDTILTNALQYMKEASNLGPGVVLKISSNGQHVRTVFATPDFDSDAKELEQAISQRIRARQAAGKTVDPARFLADCLAQERGKPAITIPVEVTGRVVGMFAFWSTERAELESEVRLILQLAADVIARKVAMDSLCLRFCSHEESAVWQEGMRTSIEAASNTRLKFAALSKAIAERFQASTVTLSVMPQGSRITRFTWTRGDRTLVERQLPSVPVDSLTGPAFYSGQTIVCHNLSDERRPGREEVLIAPSARSLVALPSRIVGDVTTVLTLTSEKENAFGYGAVAEVHQLSPLIALVVLPELLRETRRREAVRTEKLVHMLNLVNSEHDPQLILNDLAAMMSEEYDADLLRISSLDETGRFLESKVLVSAVALQCTVPAHGRIILSLTPMHERVMKTGLPMVISQRDGRPGMSEIESAQTLTDSVTHAAIMPVLRDGRSIGVMTLGAVDHELNGIQDSGGLAFAEALAAVATMHISSKLPAPEGDSRLSRNGARRVCLPADIFS